MRDRSSPGRSSHRRAGVAVAVLLVLASACSSPRTILESFPPITCSVLGTAGVVDSATVRINGDPQTIEVRDMVFTVDYRSHEQGRQLETSLRRSSGELVQRVSYVVPGRTALRNQFGSTRGALTGEHDILPGENTGLRWSCGVNQGEAS